MMGAMTKTLTMDLTYDAPLDAVAAMVADPAFREKVCDAQRALRREVTVTEGPAGREITVDYAQAADGVPSFAKKLVGDEIQIVQREVWSSPTEGDVEVTIPGKPGQMSGRVSLTEAGGVTTQHTELDIKVSIPLVGGKVEQLVHDLMTKALRREHRVGQEWLRG